MITEYIANLGVQFWFVVLITLFIFISVMIIIPLIVINIPDDYFSDKEHKGIIKNLIFPLSWIIIILKNGIGFLFICIGILLLFLPGQGLLTIFTGLMFMNFPGKRAIELYIVRNKTVLNAINWLRCKAGKRKIIKIYSKRIQGKS